MLLGHKTREVMLHWRGFWDGTVRKGVVPAVVTFVPQQVPLPPLCGDISQG